jgi:hypothetical protein
VPRANSSPHIFTGFRGWKSGGGDATLDPEIAVAGFNLRDADLVLGFDFVSSRRMWLSYGSRRIFLSRPKR